MDVRLVDIVLPVFCIAVVMEKKRKVKMAVKVATTTSVTGCVEHI